MRVKRGGKQASFTLVETMMAMVLMTVAVLQVVGSQGKSVYISGYNKMSSDAIWLAKRVMSQVEYNWLHYDFKALNDNLPIKNAPFDGAADNMPFRYDLSIDEFKFPITDLIFGEDKKEKSDSSSADAGGASKSDAGASTGGLGGGGIPEAVQQMVKEQIKLVFDDQLLKLAHVTVYWGEGARRDSVELTYMLTNQRALNEALVTAQPVIKSMMQEVDKDLNAFNGGASNNPTTTGTTTKGGTTTTGGTNTGGTNIN